MHVLRLGVLTSSLAATTGAARLEEHAVARRTFRSLL